MDFYVLSGFTMLNVIKQKHLIKKLNIVVDKIRTKFNLYFIQFITKSVFMNKVLNYIASGIYLKSTNFN